jgi:WD40 repeat protein
MIALTCPHCRTTVQLEEKNADQQVRCPACRQPVTVQRPAAPGRGPIDPPHHESALTGPETVNVPSFPDGPRTHPAPSIDAIPGYEILGELGRGGMGVVYKARQVGLNRLCALKMILAGGHAGEDDLARFRREAEAIARLHHPNIVAVYEVGEHEGRAFFSLELCAGGSLDRKLAGAPVEPQVAAKLVRTLADAMQAAHQASVIHRDLKPANVLLVDPPQTPLEACTPKISDFGLARTLDEGGQTQSGAVLGTPSYMAPEQAGGRSTEMGPATDVYALGAILYELLAGRPPFRAATSFDTLVQVKTEEPVPPRQLNARVPADLETISLKCLLKDPAKRYAGAQELADDLGRYLAGEPIRARPSGRLGRAVKWARRNPAVAALSASLVVLLLAATGLSLAAVSRFANLNRDLTEAKEAAEGETNRATEAANHAQAETEKARKALAEEGKARARERAERIRRAEAADLARQRLGRLYLENGLRARDRLTQVVWFHEALKWDRNPQRADLHRMRVLAHALDQPHLEHFFPVENARKGRASLTSLRREEPRDLPSARFSKDRRYLVVETLGSATCVWDTRSREKVIDLPGPAERAGGERNTATAQVDSQWRQHAREKSRFLAGGRRFLARTGIGKQLWDLEKRQSLTPLIDVTALVSPDERWLITSPPRNRYEDISLPREYQVREVESGKVYFTIGLDFSPGIHFHLFSVLFEDGGRRIVFFDREGGKASGWDLATGKKVTSALPPEQPGGKAGIRLRSAHLLVPGQGTPRTFVSGSVHKAPGRKPVEVFHGTMTWTSRSGQVEKISTFVRRGGSEAARREGGKGTPGCILDGFTGRRLFPPPGLPAEDVAVSDDEAAAFVRLGSSRTPSPEAVVALAFSSAPLGAAVLPLLHADGTTWQLWDPQQGKPLGPVVRVPVPASQTFPLHALNSGLESHRWMEPAQVYSASSAGLLSRVELPRNWLNAPPRGAPSGRLLLVQQRHELQLWDLLRGRVGAHHVLPNLGDEIRWGKGQLGADGRHLLVAYQRVRAQTPDAKPQETSFAQLLSLPDLRPVAPPIELTRPGADQRSGEGRLTFRQLDDSGTSHAVEHIRHGARLSRSGRYLEVHRQPDPATDSPPSVLYEILPTGLRQVKLLSPLGATVPAGTLSPQEEFITWAGNDRTLLVHRLPEGRLVLRSDAPRDEVSHREPVGVTWLEGRRLMVTRPGAVEVWNLSRALLPASVAEKAPAWDSASGRWVKEGGELHRRFRMTRSAAGTALVTITEQRGKSPPVTLGQFDSGLRWGATFQAAPSFRFSPDGERLVGLGTVAGEKESRAGRLLAWDVKTAKPVPVAEQEETSPVKVLSLSRQARGPVRRSSARLDPLLLVKGGLALVQGQQPIRLDGELVAVHRGHETVYVQQADGRITPLPGGNRGSSVSNPLPGRFPRLQDAGTVTANAFSVITQPDARTAQSWYVSKSAPLLIAEVKAASPIVYAGPRGVITAEGKAHLWGRRNTNVTVADLRGAVSRVVPLPVVVHQSPSAAPAAPLVLFLLFRPEGKLALLRVTDPGRGQGRIPPSARVQPLGGSVAGKVLEWSSQVVRQGASLRGTLVLRTADALLLWRFDRLDQPPAPLPFAASPRTMLRCGPGAHQFLVTVDDAGRAALWDLDRPRRAIRRLGEVHDAAADPSSALVALRLRSGKVVLWTARPKEPLDPTLKWSEPIEWDIGKDRLVLVVGSGIPAAVSAEGRVRFFDWRAGKAAEGNIRHGGAVESIYWPTPDRLLTAGKDGAVRLWAWPSRRPLGAGVRLEHGVARVGTAWRRSLLTRIEYETRSPRIARVETVSGAPVIIVAGPARAALLDRETGLTLLNVPVNDAGRVELAPDAYGITTVQPDGTLRTRSIGAAVPVRETRLTGKVIHLEQRAYSEDGLLTAEGRTVRLWAPDGKPFGPVIEHPLPVAWARLLGSIHSFGQGREWHEMVLVCGQDGAAQCYDIRSGQKTGPRLAPRGGFVGVFAVPASRSVPETFYVFGRHEVLQVSGAGEPRSLFTFASPLQQVKAVNVWPESWWLSFTGSPQLVLTLGKEVRTLLISPDETKAPHQLSRPLLQEAEVTGVLTYAPSASAGLPPLVEIKGHTDGPREYTYAASSPDGGLGLVTLAGHKAQRWEVVKRAGKQRTWRVYRRVGAPLEHDGAILLGSIQTDQAGRRLLWAVTADAQHVWDLTEGRPVSPPRKHPGGRLARAELADRTLVLLGADGRAWTQDAWSSVPARVEDHPLRFFFGPSGQLFTGSRFGELRNLAPVPGGYRPGNLFVPEAAEQTAEFADDGKALFLLRGNRLERWSVPSGKRASQVETGLGPAVTLEPLPGGRLLTTQVDGSRFWRPNRYLFRLWDAATGRPLSGVLESKRAIRLTPDGRLLIGATGPTARPVLRAWKVATGKEVPPPPLPRALWDASLSPNWKYHLTAAPGWTSSTPDAAGYRVHDAWTGKPLTPVLKGSRARFSADGRYLLVGERIYDPQTGTPIAPEGMDAAGLTVQPENAPEPRVNAPSLPSDWGVGLRPAPGWEWSPRLLRWSDETVSLLVYQRTALVLDNGGEIGPVPTEEWLRLAARIRQDQALTARGRQEEVETLQRLLPVASSAKQSERAAGLLRELRALDPTRSEWDRRWVQAQQGVAEELFHLRQYHLASTRYAELIAAFPEETRGAVRYDAACAASLAGAVRGPAGAAPPEAQPGWRRQAFRWLSAELKDRRERLSPATANPLVEQMLHWQRSPDFRGVREARGLLPPRERESWDRLWEEVEGLRKKALARRPPRWRIEGKELVMTGTAGGPILFGEPKWSDYDLEAELMRAEGAGEIRIHLRVDSPRNWSGVALGVFSNSAHALIVMKPDQASPLVMPAAQGATVQVSGGLENGKWYRLRIEVRRDLARVHLEGRLILQTAARPSTGGRMGMDAFSPARFRNLKVTDATGKLLFEGLPKPPRDVK